MTGEVWWSNGQVGKKEGPGLTPGPCAYSGIWGPFSDFSVLDIPHLSCRFLWLLQELCEITRVKQRETSTWHKGLNLKLGIITA